VQRLTFSLPALAVTAIVALAACGSSGTGTGASAGVTTASTAKSAAAQTSATVKSAATQSTATQSSAAQSTASGAKAATVNANTASMADLTAAFKAAGVPSPDRWAKEVSEYRPYTDDNWAHLRTQLDKYNIDDATFNQITGALSL
jgi:hypothetical protein